MPNLTAAKNIIMFIYGKWKKNFGGKCVEYVELMVVEMICAHFEFGFKIQGEHMYNTCRWEVALG